MTKIWSRAALAVAMVSACTRRAEPSARSKALAASAVASKSSPPEAGTADLTVDAAPSARPTPPAGMAFIPAGAFTMGTDRGATFEGPPRSQAVRAFFLDLYEVTNEAFARFVTATNHTTAAEKVGESSVFVPRTHAWAVVRNASWRFPDGSNVRSRPQDPVVQVTWSDADSYCRWTGGRLPTEIEWERAARGGVDAARFPWGDDEVDSKSADGRPRANVWQGRFPDRDDGSDGFRGLAPVGSFSPNPFGLFDMAGNVWEWTDAFFDAKDGTDASNTQRERVIRGGSWLCSASHCVGYRTAARGKAVAGEGTNHIGFRCARDP